MQNSEYISLERYHRLEFKTAAYCCFCFVDVEVKLSNVNPCILFSHNVARVKALPWDIAQ